MTASNKKYLDAFFDYIEAVAKLEEMAPPTVADYMTPLDTKSAYLETLASFCTLHKFFHDQKAALCFAPECDDIKEDLLLSAMVQSFELNFGCTTSDAHVGPAIGGLVASLQSVAVGLNPVSSSTITDPDARIMDFFAMLVKSPTLVELLATTTGGDAALSMVPIGELPHMKLFANLCELVHILSIERLQVAGMHKASGDADDSGVPTCAALAFLRMTSCCRTVAFYAGAMVDKMAPLFKEQRCDEETLLDTIPQLDKLFMSSLESLGEFLDSKEAKSLESEGWHLTTTLPSTTSWHEAMRLFRGRLRAVLYDAWADWLGNASAATSAALPPIASAITDEKFDEGLALSLVKGAMPKITKTYQAMHTRLGRLRDAASLMDMTPALQKHEATRSSVAVAMHTLGNARDVMVVAQGVLLLDVVRVQPGGPKQIVKFLNEVHPECRSTVPAAFWAYMDAFAKEDSAMITSAFIAPTPTTSSPSGQGTKEEVKHEEHEEGATSPASASASVATSAATPALVGQKLKRRRKD